jgi:sulfonate transport system permease protein
MSDTPFSSPLAAPRDFSRLHGAIPRGAVVPLALVLAWLVIVDGGFVHQPLLVPLTQILRAPFTDAAGTQIWAAMAASLLRVLSGFVIGAGLGVALGTLLGLSRTAASAVSPSVHTLRQITLFAWIPLLTAWFGNGETPKLVFIALSAFFPTFLNAEQGFRAVPRGLREVAAVLRLSTRARILKLMLPGALPSILIGLQVGLLTAWIGTVGAEYAIGSGRGLGAYLAAAREQFRMDLVLCGVLALAGIGYAMAAGLDRTFSRLIKWQNRP